VLLYLSNDFFMMVRETMLLSGDATKPIASSRPSQGVTLATLL
jgi:hypothetical protein